MNAQETVRETVKLPVRALKGHLSGTTLELTRDGKTSFEYRRIDLSKMDFFFRGLDSEGFLTVEILPTNAVPENDEEYRRMHESPDFKAVEFNPRRRRQHGNVTIPPGYSPYLEVKTKLGGAHKVFVNHKQNFLIKVETNTGGSRLHNLGEMGDPKSWIARFKAEFDKWQDWKDKKDIKKLLREARMYDSQKMEMGLLILEKLELIKKSKNNDYASVNLPLPVESQDASGLEHPSLKKKKNQGQEKSEE